MLKGTWKYLCGAGSGSRSNPLDLALSFWSNEHYGWTNPILVQSKTHRVLAGHGRLLAAQQAGLKTVPVVFLDLSDEDAAAYTVADNQLATLSEWDMPKLKDVLADLSGENFDLSLTGFSEEDLARMLAWEPEKDYDPALDAVPDLPKTPKTKPGDLYVMGDHRLVCGDATDRSTLLFATDENKPDLVCCDPPYGIGIVKGNKVGGGGTLKFGKVGGDNWVDSKTYAVIQNDDSTDTTEQFYAACQELQWHTALILWGGNYFTKFLPPSPCWLIWDKQNTGNFADVEMAWSSFDKAAKLYRWMWNGLARQGERALELTSRVHPTQKPVGLFSQIFQDFPGNTILDGFAGSGTTLIAAESLTRRCYGLEIEPRYCDVIVDRWETYAGKKAARHRR
jgi:DNA modification methylase